MYFQYSTSECKFFVALQLFLATEFRPKVSAEIRHFSPKVSVSAESQNPTFGRTLHTWHAGLVKSYSLDEIMKRKNKTLQYIKNRQKMATENSRE